MNVLSLTIPLCLLISCELALAGIAGIIPDKLSERSYGEIGKYLNERLPNATDPETDMKEALGWLESRLKLTTFSAEKESLLRAFDQLNGLEWLKDDIKCDLESFNILQANNQSTKGAAFKDDQEFNSTNRVHKMIHYYFKKHANSCKDQYLSLFKSKVEQLDSKEVVKVETMRNGFVEAILLDLRKHGQRPHKYPLVWDPETFPKKGFRTSLVEIRQLLHINHSLEQLSNLMFVLEFLSQYDPDRKWLGIGGKEFNYDKVEALYERHIAKPCEYYVNQLTGLNHMFAFDNHIVSMYPDDQRSEHGFDLYLERAGYRLCKDLLRKPLLDHFVYLIDQGNK